MMHIVYSRLASYHYLSIISYNFGISGFRARKYGRYLEFFLKEEVPIYRTIRNNAQCNKRYLLTPVSPKDDYLRPFSALGRSFHDCESSLFNELLSETAAGISVKNIIFWLAKRKMTSFHWFWRFPIWSIIHFVVAKRRHRSGSLFMHDV